MAPNKPPFAKMAPSTQNYVNLFLRSGAYMHLSSEMTARIRKKSSSLAPMAHLPPEMTATGHFRMQKSGRQIGIFCQNDGHLRD